MKGQFFISNIDGEIHNLKDVKHEVISHPNFVEVLVLQSDDEIIDSCVLYNNLTDLINVINS